LTGLELIPGSRASKRHEFNHCVSVSGEGKFITGKAEAPRK